ncbi:hypothetical protein JL721_9828 [Aureococcus anophagefferens]|nr:hypothetical protein JL721_9828 [Aureococcus anophagefferens]
MATTTLRCQLPQQPVVADGLSAHHPRAAHAAVRAAAAVDPAAGAGVGAAGRAAPPSDASPPPRTLISQALIAADDDYYSLKRRPPPSPSRADLRSVARLAAADRFSDSDGSASSDSDDDGAARCRWRGRRWPLLRRLRGGRRPAVLYALPLCAALILADDKLRDAVMKALGVPWAARVAIAKSKNAKKIAHEGRAWVEATTTAVVTKTQTLCLDGSEQKDTNPWTEDGQRVDDRGRSRRRLPHTSSPRCLKHPPDVITIRRFTRADDDD